GGGRPVRISDYIILACADIFIADSSRERERRTDRHDDIAASEGGAEAIVERAVGRGGEIARAERPPKGQPPGPHADARTGIVRRRMIGSVGEPEAIEMVVDRGVADPVARVDRERAGTGREARPGEDAIDVDRGVAIDWAEEAALARGPRGEAAGVEREQVRHRLDVDQGEAGMAVAVAGVPVPADLAVVA